MKTEPEYQLDDYVFWDRSNWYDRSLYAIGNSIYRISKMPSLMPPIRHKKYFRNFYKPVSLVELGAATGIAEKELIIFLDRHRKRENYYKWFAGALSFFITYIPLMIVLILAVFTFVFIARAIRLDNNSTIFSVFFFFIVIPAIGVVSSYGFRIASFIADRYFADTLCIMASLDLLIELSRENSLVMPDLQRSLLFRLRLLTRSVLLLPYCYESPYDVNNAWAKEFFKSMANRVQEYERWIIAPKETTLSDLRKEINELTHVFITRNYGTVSYELPAVSEPTPESRLSQINRLVTRLVGIVVPGLILGMLYLYPDQVTNTGLDKNIVGLISLAWLLLTIDASLGLGVVERISGLAKAIKELK